MERQVVKSKKYYKSLKLVPKKDRDQIESEVDRLETDLTGVVKIEGTKDQARLDVGDYRVFLHREKGKAITVLHIEEAVRRTTTTYRKR